MQEGFHCEMGGFGKESDGVEYCVLILLVR
jgi:hypothetical protein